MEIKLLVGFIFLLIFTLSLNSLKIILVFIAEKGPECFSEKKDAIMECMNSTFSGYVPTETPTLASLPNFVLGEKECADMKKLETCIVTELENCEESTPANLVESLFKFVKNETPCVNMTKTAPPKHDQHIKANSGQTNKFSINILVGTFMMALFVKVVAH